MARNCVDDGDGQVDYKEFVDVLARDTVAPAALGKRDMQAKEAMGVESLDKEFLGHKNAPKSALGLGALGTAPPTPQAAPATYSAPAAAPAPKAVGTTGDGKYVGMASTALNSRFSDMFKAFQYVDLDRSGTLDEKEISRALDMWNVPVDKSRLAELISACDRAQLHCQRPYHVATVSAPCSASTSLFCASRESLTPGLVWRVIA